MKNSLARFNFFYTFLRPGVDYGTYNHYRQVTIKGRENIPQGGHYIFAPCHQNALMDALLVLNITHRPVAFLARADIFKQPAVAAFLHFLRISPVYRIRDGRDQLGRNEQVFRNAQEVIESGMPLCLMAEGTHNDKHQLLPLVKGMFRIAGETQKSLGSKPLYIVPMGFDYDEYQQIYSSICVNIGKPIPVQQYMDDYLNNEPVALNRMRNDLAVALRSQIHHVNAKERYEDEFAYCHMQTQDVLKGLQLKNTPWGRFMARKHVSEQIAAMPEEERTPLYDQGAEYLAQVQRSGVPLWFASKGWNAGKSVLSILAVVLTVVCAIYPIWPLWLLANPIVYLPTHLIPKAKIKDPQFRSSVNYGIRLFVTFLYIVISGLVFCFTKGIVYALMMAALGLLSVHITPRIFMLLRDVWYSFKWKN